MKIITENLSKHYGEINALDSLNIAVNDEIYGLLGPNGSGKTTTMSMLCTLLKPTSGNASICGYDIKTEQSKVRDSISFVPQDLAVDVNLTGRENVDFHAKLYGIRNKSVRKKIVDEALAIMDLTERANERTRGYSGGMRRRLEFAQAIVHEPEILFLDEPTIGLDVSSRRSVWEYVVTLRNKGTTIFVSTHQMDEAERYCDRVGILKKGILVNEGTPSDLTSQMNTVITIRTGPHTPFSTSPEGTKIIRDENGEVMFSSEDVSCLQKILEMMEKHNVKVYSSTISEPTLEDVYLQSQGHLKTDNESFDSRRFEMMLRRTR